MRRLLPIGRGPGERAAAGDARLIGRVRWRLVGWSGAITLAILLVLGGAVYGTTASNLAAGSETLCHDRASEIAADLARIPFSPESHPDAIRIGFAVGGPGSGTLAVIVTPDDQLILPGGINYTSLPIRSGVLAARENGRVDMRTTSIGPVPVRVVSDPVDTQWGRYVVQVIADRTAEQRTLSTLLLVLLVGGLGAVALALAGGWFYARRALVPIRDSLQRQREFAADASHELRTPLTVLRTSVDYLRRNRAARVGEVGGTLEDMTAEVDHMTDLVEGLLLLARADSGVVELQRDSMDLADAAAAALGELTPTANERGVHLSLDAQPTPIGGDFGRLRQLAVILVDNAIRHGGGGNRVEVVVGRDGSQALLRVDDTGRGMRPEDVPHVFDRFWRAADAPEGGVGLGLAIARWIAERHGGTISAGQRPGGGARFEVRLPA